MWLCTRKGQFWWNQYLGVSHLSGIPFSFPLLLLSEISQPDYVHVNTCNNVQIMHPNANIDKPRFFCLIHFSVSQWWRSFKWFSYFKWRTWGNFMSEIKYGKFKIGCITCKWTSKRPDKMLQMIFVLIFAMCSFRQKRLCQWNARKWSIMEDFDQNDSLRISYYIKQYQKHLQV